MWPRFGVKIGNSTLCVASIKKDGKIEVIANKQGDRVSQAVLLYDGDEIEVGLSVKQKMISKGSSTICNSFQLFPKDLNDEDIDKVLKYIPCEFNKDTKKFCLRSHQDESEEQKDISPFDVCVELFKTCFELARQCHLFEEHPSVVLSIPHYYPISCWQDLADAAETAGFYVAQIITEATAALMAYEPIEDNNDNENNEKTVLCIKSGGLLTSFTLIKASFNVYSTVGSSQPFYLGGNQLTDVLIEFIAGEFYKKYKLDPKESRRSMAKIRIAADNCKHSLTTLPSTQVYIDSLMDGVDFNTQMSRARFESLIQPFLNEFMTTLNNFLDEFNKDGLTINEIILAGGTMKIPKIQTAIKSKFPNATLKVNFSPDEVSAVGCAQQAFYINPKIKELKPDLSCTLTTDDVFIWCNSDIEGRKLLIKKGTILPNKSIVEFEKSDKKDPENLTFHIQSKDDTKEILMNCIEKLDEILRIEALVDVNINELQIKLKLI